MLDKKKVMATIREMPDSFSTEDLLDRILLMQKIESGLLQSKNNQTVSEEEAKYRLTQWINCSKPFFRMNGH